MKVDKRDSVPAFAGIVIPEWPEIQVERPFEGWCREGYWEDGRLLNRPGGNVVRY